MTDTKIPRVFISSTLEDLESFRGKAREAILRLGWLPIDSGYWAARGNPPLDTCLKMVDDADVVVCIVAHRHGWTPPDQPGGGTKSITRLECERARRENRIDVIPFFVDESASWDVKLREENRISEASTEKIGEVALEVARNVTSLREFKAWLEGTATRTLVSNPDELCTGVLHALSEWGRRHGKSEVAPSSESVRTRYLGWLRRTCESVELLGLDLKEAQNVRLGQVYVPAVMPPRGPISKWDVLPLPRELVELRRRGRRPSPRDLVKPRGELLLHCLGKESLYVSGPPGAGKSTFCLWVALSVASGSLPAHPVGLPEEYEERLPEDLRTRFPVLCRLREWAGHVGCLEGNGHWSLAELERSLSHWLAVVKPGGLTPEVFRKELAGGRCLLILDGLDEVPEAIGPHLPRRNLITGLADALPEWLKAGNRVLLTSRPYGLDESDRRKLKLPIARISELPGPLQAVFVRRWYAAADPSRAGEKASGLLAHLDDRGDLDELRANPMLLTALCVKYDEGQRLPKDFYRLYDSVVSQVLHKRYFTENERDRARLRLAAVALGMHRGGSDSPRVSPEAEVGIDEVDRILAELAQGDWAAEGGGTDAASRREDLLSNSGLLLPRANRRAGFYHLSFQEFLAAARIRRLGESVTSVLARHAMTPEWRRTLVFLFCAIADQQSPEVALGGYALLLDHLAAERMEPNSNPALVLFDCLEIAHARGWNIQRFTAPLRQACDLALNCLEPPARADLWRTFGMLGLDDRPGVHLRDGLPDIAWEYVPAGGFKCGEHAKEVTLGEFRIARYPVTNAQYQCFIDEGGYEQEQWWQGFSRPSPPIKPGWSYANHPRENVSWFEAMAFGRWVDARLRARLRTPDGWQIRLPSEKEWEKAARGTDGREYPWGRFESGRANIDENQLDAGPYCLRRTSAVGIYPDGASPYGAMDMAGNVAEWCLDIDDSAGISEAPPRIFRGAAWNHSVALCSAIVRGRGMPNVRSTFIGFRLCCAPV